MPIEQPQLIVIGAGVMGSALLLSALDADLLEAASVTAIDPDARKLAPLAARGVRCLDSIESLHPPHPPHPLRAAEPSIVLIAIKPQSLPDATHAIATLLRPGDTLISIMAGVTLARLSQLAPVGVGVIRAMPSTPARIGMGVTGLALAPDLGPFHPGVAFADRFFRTAGPTVMRIDESMMDAFTAIAGSGPAYVFYLAEALTIAAQQVGFTPEQADTLVRATLLGSATLLSRSPDQTAAALRASVTSKGGTTNAACTLLDSRDVMDAFTHAIIAARDRGQELGKGS
ncbi:MAG: pyrroline-5-carboxylate reductase [Phycisphaerales bacterium]|nr:pyrroline-5-carboxylate reductase [Phycisphaerales bacterium]